MRAIVASFIATVALVGPVLADGGFVGPRMAGRAGGMGGVSSPGQKAIVIDGGDGTELLILQTTYRGPAEDFAWIVPVPGLPTTDGVFAPDPYFIEMAFALTQVRTWTDVRVQTQQSGLVFAGRLASEKGGGADAGGVTVHRRMAAGDYDAAVISTGSEWALLDWLRAEGYAADDRAREAFAHYIGRGWHFVALKVRPEVARERPVLADVQPIAIRFPTDRLVFPLFISRASAPERTTLALIVLAGDAVGCKQIDWGSQTWQGRLHPGGSWASIRLGMIGWKEPAMCCESVARLLVPSDLANLGQGRWAPDYEGDPRLVATRMFTILTPEQMDDLTFDARRAPQAKPYVHRYATVRDIFARSPWAVLLAGAVFLLVMWRTRRPWRQEAVRLMAVLGVVVAVWGMTLATLAVLLVALPVLLLMTERGAARGDTPAQEDREPGRALSATIALLVLSFPVGWLALQRSGEPWFGILLGLVAGLMLVAALVLLVREALRTGWLSRKPVPEDADTSGRPPLLLAAFVATGWAGVLIAAGTSQPAPAIVAGDGALATAYWALLTVVPAPLLVLVPELAWVVATWVFLRRHLRRWPDSQSSFFFQLTSGVCLLYVLSAMLGLSLPGIFGNLDMLPQGLAAVLHFAALAMGIALLCFTVLAPFATAQSRRIAPGFATVAALMALLVVAGSIRLMTPAEAGSGSAQTREIEGRMHEALEKLDGGLARFADDTGAFPMQLSDLTAREAPRLGLDGSGNRVPIEAATRGPWLVEMPIDPLTGSRDTWAYEVTGAPMVASGAYAIEVEWRDGQPWNSADLRLWAENRHRESPDFPARIMEGLGLRSQSEVR